MAERAPTAVIQEADVQGISTRSVGALVKAMGMAGRWGWRASPSPQVSRLRAPLDARGKASLDRPLDGDGPCVPLDAPDVQARQNSRVVSVAVIVPVELNHNGRREVLGLDIGPPEAETFGTAFLRQLTRRGLRGVRLTIALAREGMTAPARGCGDVSMRRRLRPAARRGGAATPRAAVWLATTRSRGADDRPAATGLAAADGRTGASAAGQGGVFSPTRPADPDRACSPPRRGRADDARATPPATRRRRARARRRAARACGALRPAIATVASDPIRDRPQRRRARGHPSPERARATARGVIDRPAVPPPASRAGPVTGPVRPCRPSR
jgi:hypothetical protein